eukprot:CAMPEP_0204901028 /NCGR_PEP_ID=MMETSP1397-20131031/2832_1 /ASSEMBLY_ACC=CAM_ASM_000891 /TAXON_ID=49980 /ORGANISM="Climacostomum Climacostomum virens, Strain Stock W-24" /LENGTH=284 /DNA_ID=CAMNT_0052069297 /DNA_START=55 /DNA_END=909 /DNA_ORIENTATION=+
MDNLGAQRQKHQEEQARGRLFSRTARDHTRLENKDHVKTEETSRKQNPEQPDAQRKVSECPAQKFDLQEFIGRLQRLEEKSASTETELARSNELHAKTTEDLARSNELHAKTAEDLARSNKLLARTTDDLKNTQRELSKTDLACKSLQSQLKSQLDKTTQLNLKVNSVKRELDELIARLTMRDYISYTLKTVQQYVRCSHGHSREEFLNKIRMGTLDPTGEVQEGINDFLGVDFVLDDFLKLDELTRKLDSVAHPGQMTKSNIDTILSQVPTDMRYLVELLKKP